MTTQTSIRTLMEAVATRRLSAASEAERDSLQEAISLLSTALVCLTEAEAHANRSASASAERRAAPEGSVFVSLAYSELKLLAEAMQQYCDNHDGEEPEATARLNQRVTAAWVRMLERTI